MLSVIHASRVISRRRTAELTRKLLSCMSRYKRAAIRAGLRGDALGKTANDQLLYISDLIRNAIDLRRKLRFQYMEVLPDGTGQLRHNGEFYVISPYDTVWNSDRYYMVGWSDKREKIVQFRIDRMTLPELLDEPAHPVPADFDPARYSSQVMRMMDGPTETVLLSFPADLMTQVADHFSAEAVSSDDAGRCSAQVCVAVSPTFYAWVFQFGGRIRIEAPAAVAEDYQRLLRAQLADASDPRA